MSIFSRIKTDLVKRKIRYRIVKRLALRTSNNTPVVTPYASPIPDDGTFVELGGLSDFDRAEYDSVLSELESGGFIARYPKGSTYGNLNGTTSPALDAGFRVTDPPAYAKLRKEYGFINWVDRSLESASKHILTIIAVVFGAIVTAAASTYIDRKYPENDCTHTAEADDRIGSLESRIRELEGERPVLNNSGAVQENGKDPKFSY